MGILRNLSLFGVVLTAGAAVLSGCPEPPDPMLTLDTAALEFSATDQDFAVAITADDEALAWTASASQPWIVIDQTAGSGSAELMISVDRSQLDPSTAGSGRVEIRAGEQTLVIEVDAVSAFTPIDTAYFPMSVGNSWTYRVPGGFSQMVGDVVLADGLTMAVTDSFVVQGYTVWQVDLSLDQITLPVSKLSYLGLPNLANGTMGLTTYWVKVAGVWYAGTDRDALNRLPTTDTLISLAELFELPGVLAYLDSTGALEEAWEAIATIQADAATAQLENAEALNAYVNEIYWTGTTDRLFSLTGGFGAAFGAYEGSTDLMNAVVRLLADTSAGVEGFYEFAMEAIEIAIELNQRLFLLEGEGKRPSGLSRCVGSGIWRLQQCRSHGAGTRPVRQPNPPGV